MPRPGTSRIRTRLARWCSRTSTGKPDISSAKLYFFNPGMKNLFNTLLHRLGIHQDKNYSPFLRPSFFPAEPERSTVRITSFFRFK
jgi:hypothetical protein